MWTYLKAKVELILVFIILVLGALTKYLVGETSRVKESAEVEKAVMEYNHRNDMLRKELMYDSKALARALKHSKDQLEGELSELRKKAIDNNDSSFSIRV